MSLLDDLLGIRAWRTSTDLLVTDVTKMQNDRVCVAALDRDTTVRLHEPAPTQGWLRDIGGLAPGDIIRLTLKLPRRVTRPHVEDRDWSPESVAKVARVSDEELASRLARRAFTSIRAAFGKPDFHAKRGNAAFSPRKGARSLASVKASGIKLYPEGAGIKADFADETSSWSMVPVEDLSIRTHQARCVACRDDLPTLLMSEFGGGEAILRVGLGRPFQADGGPPACWLQINHVIPIIPRREHFAESNAGVAP